MFNVSEACFCLFSLAHFEHVTSALCYLVKEHCQVHVFREIFLFEKRLCPLIRKGHAGLFPLYRAIFCYMQVYSSMERLSIHEERKTPPPTKRSLSEEKDDRLDSLGGLKSRDRSWVIGSPEM